MLLRVALGVVLRRVRTDRGWSLRQLAAAAACSVGYLSEVERGRKEVSSELLVAVTAALGVPLPVLLVEAARVAAAAERVTAGSAA